MGRSLRVSLVLLLAFIMIPLSTHAASRPEGKLTIVYTTLGKETTNLLKWIAREEEGILHSLGDALVWGHFDAKRGVGAYFPSIAKSWKVSPDLGNWEFTIRKDVTFHDGTTLTLEDVIYTWNRVLKHPQSIAHSAKRQIESVEGIGDDRIVFHLKQPYPFFLYKASNYAIHPKAYTEKVGDAKFEEKPIYAGPWKFVKYMQGDYIEMEAFEGHYRKVPHYKTLLIKIVPESSTQLAMLKTGEADILFNVAVGPTISELKKDPDLRLISRPVESESYGYLVNLAKPNKPASPFWDKRVRHALSYATDRKLLVEKVYYGFGEPSAVACIIPNTSRWHPSATVFPYDIEKAKALLAEAGYPNGFETKLHITAREKTEGEALASMWRKAGIRAELTMWETGTQLNALRKRQLPDGVRISRHSSTPTGIYYYFQKDQTYTNMIDDKLHDLTREMLKFPEGPEMDSFIKEKMCRYVYDLMPCLPIVTRTIVHGVRPTIDTKEWEKIGTVRYSYGPATEYIKPKK